MDFVGKQQKSKQAKMATEVTVKIRENPLGQAFFVQQEEWDCCLSDVRSLLVNQEIETPVEYRFLTGNGNVVSPALEKTVIFRDIVEKEPFAEIKKEDSSLHSAEKRVVPHVNLVSIGVSTENTSNEDPETSCPFIKKFPCLIGVQDTLPCMRNVFKVQTLLKLAFILTCLLFLLVFVLTLGLHLLFGIGAVGGFAGTGFPGVPMFPAQQQTTAGEQESLTSLMVQLSELKVTSRFEIQDLKRKLAELEDLYLRDLDTHRQELTKMESRQLQMEKRHVEEVNGFTRDLDSMQMIMRERWGLAHKHEAQPQAGAGDWQMEEVEYTQSAAEEMVEDMAPVETPDLNEEEQI